ncbi:MAG: shikimate dehydrogenase [Clostridia bacterium]|nr:shikimate dehydrogenase [Clostridia bacterium]
MKYGLIGDKLGHSFSKDIHESLGGYEYELCEIAKDELDGFMHKRDFLGINVTLPYKERVIPYLDWIDEKAKEIGSVNTIVNKNGKLYGYNTDFYGMKMLFAHAGIDAKGCKAVILGSGGTSKTAKAVLTDLGADKIFRVSRSEKDGVITYADLVREHLDAEIIVNTTPLGMYPNIFDMPTVMFSLKKPRGVIDAVYNPLRTMTVMEGKSYGARAEGGLYMLVAQAVRASEIFLNTRYSEGTIDEIYEKLVRQKENIVLIGMPASGKTTVGKILAKKLGRRFVDTDEAITETMGMSVSDIFKKEGEWAFRRMEEEIIEKLSGEKSLVIATGGGAVLRAKNMYSLKLNGRIFFIDRPLDKLEPTESRPLSSDAESIRQRYNERYSTYCDSCDIRIDADGTPEAVADKILENF